MALPDKAVLDMALPDAGVPLVAKPTKAFCSSHGWCWANPWPQGHHLRGVWAGGGEVFWAGDHGTVLRHDGKAWSRMTSGTTKHLHGIWGSSASDVCAVGAAGTLVCYGGSAWSSASSGVTVALNAIHGTGAKDIWVVGAKGGLSIYQGQWKDLTSGTGNALNGVWGTSPTSAWAVGLKGTILHRGP